MKLAHRDLSQHAAHRDVNVFDAQDRHTYWPVSGDETMRQYGFDGRKAKVELWRSPGVIPSRATTGIRVGDTIETWSGSGVVTRVGSIAGFYMSEGVERRWTIESVRNIKAVSA